MTAGAAEPVVAAPACSGRDSTPDSDITRGSSESSIGEAPRFAPPGEGEGADALLGASLAGVTEVLDRRWTEGIRPAWEQRHREVREARTRLKELDAKHARGDELSLQEAYDRAMLTESVGGDADGALDQFRALHERAPDDVVVSFNFGTRLLARNDDAGRKLVERVIELDENAMVRACEVLRDYHWRNGRKDEADAWHRRFFERAELELAAQEERSKIRLTDRYEPHGLPNDVLENLVGQLRAVEGLRKAYLVKKHVQHLAHRPCFVLGFTASGPLRWHSAKRAAEMVAAIQQTVVFPAETFILNVEGDNNRFAPKFRRIRGARIL